MGPSESWSARNGTTAKTWCGRNGLRNPVGAGGTGAGPVVRSQHRRRGAEGGARGPGPRCRAGPADGRRGCQGHGSGTVRAGGGQPARTGRAAALARGYAGALPAGYRPEDLAGKPVRDGTSTEIGRIEALVLDQTSGAARAMVAFTPLFGQPAKTSAVAVESLVPSSRGDGFELQLTPVQLEQMPAYALDQQSGAGIDAEPASRSRRRRCDHRRRPAVSAGRCNCHRWRGSSAPCRAARPRP